MSQLSWGYIHTSAHVFCVLCYAKFVPPSALIPKQIDTSIFATSVRSHCFWANETMIFLKPKLRNTLGKLNHHFAGIPSAGNWSLKSARSSRRRSTPPWATLWKPRSKTKRWVKRTMGRWDVTVEISNIQLVGGFNPSEEYSSKWESSLNRGENKEYFKPSPR